MDEDGTVVFGGISGDVFVLETSAQPDITSAIRDTKVRRLCTCTCVSSQHLHSSTPLLTPLYSLLYPPTLSFTRSTRSTRSPARLRTTQARIIGSPAADENGTVYIATRAGLVLALQGGSPTQLVSSNGPRSLSLTHRFASPSSHMQCISLARNAPAWFAGACSCQAGAV